MIIPIVLIVLTTLIIPIALVALVAWVVWVVWVVWVALAAAVGSPCCAHGLADAAAFKKAALLRSKHPIKQIFCLDYQGDGKIAKLFGR